MRNQKILWCAILLCDILIAAVPLLTSADTGLTGLITCATHYNDTRKKIQGMLSPMTDICSICDLLKLLETGFTFVWKVLSVLLGAVMLLYGGSLMVFSAFTANSNLATKGRTVLWHAVLGLVIVFCAWVAVDSILKLLGAQYWKNITAIELGPWNTIKCDAPSIKFIGGPVDVIPPAYQCPDGATTYKVDGLDVCDAGVQRAMVTRGSIVGSGSGQCKAENVKKLNDTYGSMLDRIAGEEGVDPKLLRAVALIESSGNPKAVGPNTPYGQACGLVQVLPSTAGMSCDDLKDPEKGGRAGAKYIKAIQNSSQVQRLGGDQKYVLMKYNATAQALEPSNDCKPPAYRAGMVKGECPINPGGFTQTINYVSKVQSCLNSL